MEISRGQRLRLFGATRIRPGWDGGKLEIIFCDYLLQTTFQKINREICETREKRCFFPLALSDANSGSGSI